MSKRFMVILLLCVAVFVGLIVFNKKDAEAPNEQGSTTTQHSQGAGSSGVTLVEYADFQCPACEDFYPLLKEVKAKYGDQITFQFKHFPIVSIHPNAMTAHRAAEAAGRQNKFWEMHDALYERQAQWATSNEAGSIFEGYAEELGLDMDQYRRDVASSEVQAAINADRTAGEEEDVTGTPTFFLDGRKLDNTSVRTIEEFSRVIDEAIAERASDNGNDQSTEPAQ